MIHAIYFQEIENPEAKKQDIICSKEVYFGAFNSEYEAYKTMRDKLRQDERMTCYITIGDDEIDHPLHKRLEVLIKKQESNMKLTKQKVIVDAFLEHGSLNRFEAEKIGDHCLHTTISSLVKKGYLFNSEWEIVPTRFGTETRVKRYRLIQEPKRKAPTHVDA